MGAGEGGYERDAVGGNHLAVLPNNFMRFKYQSKMNLQDVTKLFDLEYYNGPLLSLFADSEGNFYLYKWYDLAEASHQ